MQLLMRKGNADSLVYGTPVESHLPAPQAAQQNAILSISGETFQKLKAIIEQNIQKPLLSTGSVMDYEKTRRKLNAVIQTIGEAVDKPGKADRIKTPQELADQILAYYESMTRGQEAPKPAAACVDISLLTSEIIKRYLKAEPSILIFHLVSKDGTEYEHGHATAAIVVNGWLVDPALQSEAIHFDHIILDRQADGYEPFYAKLKEKYSSVEGGQLFSNCVFIEFSQVKSDSELQAFYLLENAVRMNAPEHGTQEESDAFYLRRDAAFIEAYKLDPGNYYAAINAGDAYKHAGDIASARRAYLSAAAHNASLYLAGLSAAGRLLGLGADATNEDLIMAHKLIHVALDIMKKEGYNWASIYSFQSQIAKKLGYNEEAEEAQTQYEKCTGR